MVLAFQLHFSHARNGCGDGIDGIPGPGRARTTVDSEHGNLNVRQSLRDGSVACQGEVIRQGVGNAEERGPPRHCLDAFIEVRARMADEHFHGAFPVSLVQCLLDPVPEVLPRLFGGVPGEKVAWAATEGAPNAGQVSFEDLGGGQTSVHLSLEYEPQGLVERVGDKLNIVDKQAENDLNRFKTFIEDEGYATGAWRGTVSEGAPSGAPGVETAAASRGDGGKAGVSSKVVAGAGLAAAAAVGVAAAAGAKDSEGDPAPRAAKAVPPTGTAGSVFPGEGLVQGANRPGNERVGRSDAKPFDQTNGLVDTEGDSDETALGDTLSEADRERRTGGGPGTVPPAGGSLGQH